MSNTVGLVPSIRPNARTNDFNKQVPLEYPKVVLPWLVTKPDAGMSRTIRSEQRQQMQTNPQRRLTKPLSPEPPAPEADAGDNDGHLRTHPLTSAIARMPPACPAMRLTHPQSPSLCVSLQNLIWCWTRRRRSGSWKLALPYSARTTGSPPKPS
jgi:hypothetical protein